MSKVPELINEICPSCNPRTYTKTVARLIGEEQDCGEHKEYLYQCVDCGAKLWVGEQWAVSNGVKQAE